MRGTTTAVLLLASALPSATAAQDAPPGPPPRAQVVAAAAEVMRTARYATLITVGDDGQPQARIVDPFAPDDAFTIWVATNPLTENGLRGDDFLLIRVRPTRLEVVSPRHGLVNDPGPSPAPMRLRLTPLPVLLWKPGLS